VAVCCEIADQSTLGIFKRIDCVHMKLLVSEPTQLTTVLELAHVSATLNTKSTWDTIPGFCIQPAHREEQWVHALMTRSETAATS